MTSASITEDERLLLEVIESLRGAENLRDRLLATLQSGTPSVADLVYAVKARVKEDYKVVEKIKDRRAGGLDRNPNPAYRVSNVTDLVGLRLITLYRLDVLEVIQALISAINSDTSKTAPFVAHSISEIIIYSTNPNGDVQNLPSRVKELFDGYELGCSAIIEEKPSNYSSIHMLVKGRGKYRDGYRKFQLKFKFALLLRMFGDK